MSRTISLAGRQALYSQETGEAFLLLVTIDHADLAAPIRVSSDAVNTTSRGDEFVSFPFSLRLPDDSDEGLPLAQIQIDNVDREIVQAVRSITTAPTVLTEIVRGSEPDMVEATWPDFLLRNVQYNALIVSGEMSVEQYLEEPYPAYNFTPAQFPGLF